MGAEGAISRETGVRRHGSELVGSGQPELLAHYSESAVRDV